MTNNTSYHYVEHMTSSLESNDTVANHYPNDYDLCEPNSHHEDEEVSSNEYVEEWLNIEMGKRVSRQDKEEEKDALIDILKIVVEECKTIYKNAQIKAPSSRTSKIQGVSFVIEAKEGDSTKTLQCQLPPKEINPRSFTLPCTIGIGEKMKFDMNGGICHRVPFENIFMASSVQESKYFNPLEIKTDVYSYDSPACLLFEQSTHPCSDVSIDIIDSSDDMQELEGSQEDEVGSHLLENVLGYCIPMAREGFEEEEEWESDIEKACYTPPFVMSETSEVK
uniref:Uncharacterized protein n=1 Tax=Tanacetum cinerariifolium TaxID=118510 RepID=A0A6L2P3A4_TANCI|nr:hypothetical protein [Tanacetum cinerariifolium]